jgi:putative two-component system response regulator
VQIRRVLIVDDEEANRESLGMMISSFGHKVEFARDGIEALAQLKLGIDLVLLDATMPGMDGFEVARRIREDPDQCELPIIMVTVLSSREHRLQAVDAGANDFISKPVDVTELRVRSSSLFKMKDARDAVKLKQAILEETISKRTSDLRRALEEVVDAQHRIYEAHLDTIYRLAVVAEFKDANTASHIQRISHYCALIGRMLNLPPGEVEILLHASPMHDVGKIGIPDSILLKPGRLNSEEWAIIKQHTLLGAQILRDAPSKLLQAGEIIALSHHEKWDGSGYPSGLAGERIPLYGRICAVADVFDALTSPRPYKKPLSVQEACAIMRDSRGTHFDPRILDIFLGHLDEVVQIQQRFQLESFLRNADRLAFPAESKDNEVERISSPAPGEHFLSLASR